MTRVGVEGKLCVRVCDFGLETGGKYILFGRPGRRLEYNIKVDVKQIRRGRDSSVGIAARCELDGPGIDSQCRRDFPHPSRPALGPTQPPIQWVPGLSWG